MDKAVNLDYLRCQKVLAEQYVGVREKQLPSRAASAELTEEYNLRRNEEFAALQRKANEIIFNIIETEHYDAMLSEVIFIRGEFDITDRVIKLLDAEMQ